MECSVTYFIFIAVPVLQATNILNMLAGVDHNQRLFSTPQKQELLV